MKFQRPPDPGDQRVVAPLAGAWIEIRLEVNQVRIKEVAPLAGAWIEMFYRKAKRAARGWSPPSRGRGLK